MANFNPMETSRKAFHFDLNIEKLKCHYPGDTPSAYKRAWSEIRSFMQDKGFVHTQYSGYESLDTLAVYEAAKVIKELQEKFPWFVQCAQAATLTNIGKTHDVLKLLREDAHSTQLYQGKPVRVSLREEGKNMRAASRGINEKGSHTYIKSEQSFDSRD